MPGGVRDAAPGGPAFSQTGFGTIPMLLILCHCIRRRLLDPAAVEGLRRAVHRAGWQCLETGDLCDAVAGGDGAILAALRQEGCALAGCHHRALAALAARARDDAANPILTLDLRGETCARALATLGLADAPPDADVPPPPALAGEDAWYPLIDRERCTDCGRCREFCLFGVFGPRQAGGVQVATPRNCKPNCPACARICPANAILFPKSPDRAINGAVLDAAELASARIRLDPRTLVGGDLRARLAARRRPELPPLFRQGLFGSASPRPDRGAKGEQS